MLLEEGACMRGKWQQEYTHTHLYTYIYIQRECVCVCVCVSKKWEGLDDTSATEIFLNITHVLCFFFPTFIFMLFFFQSGRISLIIHLLGDSTQMFTLLSRNLQKEMAVMGL